MCVKLRDKRIYFIGKFTPLRRWHWLVTVGHWSMDQKTEISPPSSHCHITIQGKSQNYNKIKTILILFYNVGGLLYH